jgi:translation initiation factor 2-alpha kinase 1
MLISFTAGNKDDIDNRKSLMSPQPELAGVQGCRRIRQRRRISPMKLLILLTLTIISCAAASSLGSKWLDQRLRQLAAAHLEAPTAPINPKTSSSLGQDSESPPPLLVVATHEGQVWTIDSTDGSLIAGFSTGPPLLVMEDHYEEATDGESHPPMPSSFSQSQIVPSLDGILYWRQSGDQHHDAASNEESSSNLVPIASIRDLVDNPIQMCQEADGENCDILTATSLGPSLFSLNSQGSLNWARARPNSPETTATPIPLRPETKSADDGEEEESESDTEDSNSSGSGSTHKNSLILQRHDFLVQQISTQTGEEVWNITWGSLEALDFVGQNDGSSGTKRAPSSHWLPSSNSPATSALPSLIFGNEGRSLVAVLPQPPKFLWKRDFPSVVTNVLGIEHDSWHSLNVVAEHNDMADDSARTATRQKLHQGLPSQGPQQQQQEADTGYWHWWWAGGGSGLGKKSSPHNLDLQEENGLVFIPRPTAHSLARNSWYLNHLWDSPQSQGMQNFHGYLDDKPYEHEIHHSQDTVSHPQSKELHPYPPRKLEDFYDTSNMPRLLLLPPSQHPQHSPAGSGGVFLSWSVVVAIITLFVGLVGAAYIFYGQKKRKWLAKSSEKQSSVSSSTGGLDLIATTMTLNTLNRARSVSAGSYTDKDSRASSRSRSQKLVLSNSGRTELPPSSISWGKAQRHTLNRCSSAPLMTREHEQSFSAREYSQNIHSRNLSPSRRASSALEEQLSEEAHLARMHLVKHKSAPAHSPEMVPLGGVGMIDGIPLIRYSRYQSEFREVEPLGKGGFGTVFRCCNVLDGREYAVKKVSIRSSSDLDSPGTEAFSQELHRVLREVKFLALLDHPNIVRYYTAWLEMEEDDGVAFDENTNTGTLSRRFSSELLTGLDPTSTAYAESKTNPSMVGYRPSKSMSRRTPSHLKTNKATNPLGWNNDFDNYENSASFRPKTTKPVLPSMEDCGFIFEGSDEGESGDDIFDNNYETSNHGRSIGSSDCSKSEFSHSISSSWDASYSLNNRKKFPSTGFQRDNGKKPSMAERDQASKKSVRHTLYIQMQLCSSKTLADFLSNKEARKGPAAAHRPTSGEGSVDIPYALRLFHQIVQAVHHVHQQGLIHRDLKPSNCFIDEIGTVKVGDFGLSRESNDNNDIGESPSFMLEDKEGAADNTVGVGTRSYSSPEQMNGSDYDSKTDIFSLGIMLFELLYPMYTSMERHICFQKLRADGTFPDGWHSTVTTPFPTLHELVRSMLSIQAKDRPTADTVGRHIQGLLEEYSITLHNSRHDGDSDNVIFLRVEAKPAPDVLKHTIQIIHDAASPRTVDIVQYGMRSGGKSANGTNEKQYRKAILEFALASPDVEPSRLSAWGSDLVAKLEEHDEILVARHVWHQATPAF